MTVSRDFPDFTQPIGFIEQIGALPGLPATLVNGALAVSVDTSDFATVDLVLNPGNGLTGDRMMLAAQWIANGQLVDTDVLTFHSLSNYTGTSSLSWRLEVKGTELQLRYANSGVGDLPILGVGSNRTFDRGQTVTPNGALQGNLLVTQSPVINAGTSHTFYVPPTSRAVSLTSGYAIASGTMDVRAVGVQALTPTTGRLALVSFSAATGAVINGLEAPGMGLEVIVTNNDAGNHAGFLVAWDVS